LQQAAALAARSSLLGFTVVLARIALLQSTTILLLCVQEVVGVWCQRPTLRRLHFYGQDRPDSGHSRPAVHGAGTHECTWHHHCQVRAACVAETRSMHFLAG
jgi:hypothetical protein